MPTERIIDKFEQLKDQLLGFLEMKRQIEKIEHELKMAKMTKSHLEQRLNKLD